jgi:hypothetical protein
MERTERIGVGHVQTIVDRELGWVFREQTTDDYGIDAHIEIADETTPVGKLIAVQIKSGESYFKEHNQEGVIFRFDRKHSEYWLNHSLPIIIVLYNPETKMCIWDYLQEGNISYTPKGGCKVIIPYEKTFNKDAKPILQEIVNRYSVEEIVKKYHDAVYEEGIDDVFPLKACPSCGKDNFDRKAITDNMRDEMYFTITCRCCGWSDCTQ